MGLGTSSSVSGLDIQSSQVKEHRTAHEVKDEAPSEQVARSVGEKDQSCTSEYEKRLRDEKAMSKHQLLIKQEKERVEWKRHWNKKMNSR